MPSKTENVNVGVCMIIFDGLDLGYTKGGVEVEVSSDTYETNVDQFGKTPISEVINKRSIKVKANLAETTLENLVTVTPGATLVVQGGAKATGTFTINATLPTNNQTVIINGVTVTFKTAVAGPYDILIAGSVAAQATNVVSWLNACKDPRIAAVTASSAAGVVTLTYRQFGTDGNGYTIAAGTYAAGTASGPNLTGGTEPTSKRVDVTDAVGQSLLSGAKELRLHPQELPLSDRSKDLVIPRAATAGGLQFAYKLEEERVYSVEFTGYPDSTSRLLYQLGQ